MARGHAHAHRHACALADGEPPTPPATPAPGTPRAKRGTVRAVSATSRPAFQRSGAHARNITLAERARIEATSLGADYYSALFYDGDADADGDSDGAGTAGPGPRAAAGAATQAVPAAAAASALHKLLDLHGARRHGQGGVPPDAEQERRTRVVLANVHLRDIARTDIRLRVVKNPAWCTVNARLVTLYTGARVLRGGLVELVTLLTAAGARLARRRSAVTMAASGARDAGQQRFDDAKTLLDWACTGTYLSRHGQRATVHTYNIDDRIDLGVSVAAVQMVPAAADGATPAVLVVAFAYWCLRNACADRLERLASAPPAPSASVALEAQLWPLPRLRESDAEQPPGAGPEPLDIAPGWQENVARRTRAIPLAASQTTAAAAAPAAEFEAQPPPSRMKLHVPSTSHAF